MDEKLLAKQVERIACAAERAAAASEKILARMPEREHPAWGWIARAAGIAGALGIFEFVRYVIELLWRQK